MEKQNGLLAKSNQLNIIGLIGCDLAVIGILLPVISVNVYITSIGIGHFQLTALVIIPLLLILGAAALYVLKMDKLAMIAAAAAFVAYLLIVLLGRNSSSTISILGQEISLQDILEEIGSGLNFGFGFYLSIIGYLVAIAGAFVNGKIFKSKAGAAAPNQMQYGPQGMQQNPYMAQPQNPYMNQPQMGQQMNPYMQQTAQNMQQQANPYMQQTAQNMQQQVNPYMQQTAQNMQQQANPYMQQAAQDMQQQPKTSSFAQQMQQAGQAVKKGLKKSDTNPYVQQAKQQAEQMVQQTEQFVQNEIPNGENNQ